MRRLAYLWFLWVVALGQTPTPRWWKGNLHTHTLWSDGDDFPEMIAESYRERGYHFLALSDHNTMAVGERFPPLVSAAPYTGWLAAPVWD